MPPKAGGCSRSRLGVRTSVLSSRTDARPTPRPGSQHRLSGAPSDPYHDDPRRSLASTPTSPSASPSLHTTLLPRTAYGAGTPDGSDRGSFFAAPSLSGSGSHDHSVAAYAIGKQNWAAEDDDALHDPGKGFTVGQGPSRYVEEHRGWGQRAFWSGRGIANMLPVVLLLSGLIGVFGAYPAVDFI